MTLLSSSSPKCKNSIPQCCSSLQDFGVKNAHRILDKYKGELACFNHIQGTGAVTLSAITAALKTIKTAITDVRILIYGAGSAGMGIAEQITDHLLTKGLTLEEAKETHLAYRQRGPPNYQEQDIL